MAATALRGLFCARPVVQKYNIKGIGLAYIALYCTIYIIYDIRMYNGFISYG